MISASDFRSARNGVIRNRAIPRVSLFFHLGVFRRVIIAKHGDAYSFYALCNFRTDIIVHR